MQSKKQITNCSSTSSHLSLQLKENRNNVNKDNLTSLKMSVKRRALMWANTHIQSSLHSQIKRVCVFSDFSVKIKFCIKRFCLNTHLWKCNAASVVVSVLCTDAYKDTLTHIPRHIFPSFSSFLKWCNKLNSAALCRCSGVS